MKLSTRSTYGLRAMMALAMEYGQGPILLRHIAERQQLPTTYLEQLMVPLRKARIVTATRGINGGYVLTRRPEEILLSEVIEVLEGPFELVDCASIANCSCRPHTCALRTVLMEASQMLADYFSHITLADLTSRQLEANSALGEEPILNYII